MSKSSFPQDNEVRTFPSGAKRTTDADGVRYDLIPATALHRLAMRYACGAAKYGDRNWERGLPMDNVYNHLMNHLERWRQDDRKEDHLAASAWGIFALMFFETHGPMMSAVTSENEVSEDDEARLTPERD